MITGIKLTDPVTGTSSAVLPRAGVKAATLDVQGTAREITEDTVLGDGSIDNTSALGPAAASLSLLFTAPGTFSALGDEFRSYCHPSQRPILTVTDDEWAGVARQLTLRYSAASAPLDSSMYPAALAMQLQWVVPNGRWEQAGDLVAAGVPMTIPALTGIASSATGPGIHSTAGTSGLATTTGGWHMPATSAPPEFQLVNPGNIPSQWTALLYGPCTGPKFADDTAGLAVEFTDALVLAAGDYVLLDSARHTALQTGVTPVMTLLNFATTLWWQLGKGLNQLRYYPTSGSAGAYAQLYYRPGWMA